MTADILQLENRYQQRYQDHYPGATTLPARLRHYWQRARQRRMLAELDDHLLKDIGISRVDALREARKPFWRA